MSLTPLSVIIGYRRGGNMEVFIETLEPLMKKAGCLSA
jgi:hypothetical protein